MICVVSRLLLLWSFWSRHSRRAARWHAPFAATPAVGTGGRGRVVQTLINHVDFGMSLPAALNAPRVSQTNSSSNTSLAEPAFYNSALAHELTSQYGERFTPATGSILPLDNHPGDARRSRSFGTAAPRRSPSATGWAVGARLR